MGVLDKIEHLMKERGWSKYRLAKEADMSEGVLNNLFRLNNQPTIPTLETICRGFGISLSQFFAEDGEAVLLNEEQRKMLDLWNTLNKEQKFALIEFLKTI